MKCQQFRNVMQDVARDVALLPVDVRNALTHADSCEPCDSLLQEAESLTQSLRALALRHSAEEAPARVEKLVLTAFRRQHDAGNAIDVSRVPDSRSRYSRAANLRLLTLAAAMGVAAVALLIVSVVRNTNRNAPVERSQPRISVPAENVPTAPGSAPSPRNTLSASASDSEDPTAAFVPLSGSFDSSSLDSDTVVRVVLSPAALASLGFPVAEEPVAGDVTADLLLAQDGTPEGIRLLNDNELDQSVGLRTDLQ